MTYQVGCSHATEGARPIEKVCYGQAQISEVQVATGDLHFRCACVRGNKVGRGRAFKNPRKVHFQKRDN